MTWPQATDYNAAIQNPKSCFGDPDLRSGHLATDMFGLPRPHSGNFADVYQVTGTDGRDWAVKCFTRPVSNLQQRYQAVSAHLVQNRRPFMVDFHFLPKGIRVRGQWYPILKMSWVAGQRLNEFVAEHLERPAILARLAPMFVRLGQEMCEARMAHGDLQHGNILMVPGRTTGSLALRLIDYDGMFVPSLAQQSSGEVGHPHFQHPQRLREGLYHADMDRFSLLLIATTLQALTLGGKALWNRYDNGENLLFRESDFRTPSRSALLKELWSSPNEKVRSLVGHLMLSSQSPMAAVPKLTSLVADSGETRRLTAAQIADVRTLLDPPRSAIPYEVPTPRAISAILAAPTLAVTKQSVRAEPVYSASPDPITPEEMTLQDILRRWWPLWIGMVGVGLLAVGTLLVVLRKPARPAVAGMDVARNDSDNNGQTREPIVGKDKLPKAELPKDSNTIPSNPRDSAPTHTPKPEPKPGEPFDPLIPDPIPTEPVEKPRPEEPKAVIKRSMKEVEDAVEAGLEWLALHQAQDGHWSLTRFNQFARDKPLPEGRNTIYNYGKQMALGTAEDDVAGTGLALLPFLNAGYIDKADKEGKKHRYSKAILAGLQFLMNQQNRTSGMLSRNTYAHAIATTALCNAYGLTGEVKFKQAAQQALNYIASCQHEGGGWRYNRGEPGDLSVTGWQLKALKSGKMHGLKVPAVVLRQAEVFVESCQIEGTGTYCYIPGGGAMPTMTACGLFCRQFFGVSARNPGLRKGVEYIKGFPPSTNNLYYLYYATQVMHELGGEDWIYWSEGPNKNDGIIDILLKKMDRSEKAGATPMLYGSWHDDLHYTAMGGRVMSTSLALLCLQVALQKAEEENESPKPGVP